MKTKQVSPCIFCGTDTEEELTTHIGVIYIHAGCLADLDLVLSLTVEDVEEIKILE